MKLRILHLEDNPMDAQLVRMHLARRGLDCDIQEVSSEPQYLAALERQHFDAILCDSGLPGYDGHAAFTAAQERNPQAPFIVVSGHVSPAHKRAPPGAGPTAYVEKSDLDQLARLLAQAIKTPTALPDTHATEAARNAPAGPALTLPHPHSTEPPASVRQLTAELEQRSAELNVVNLELEALSFSVAHDLRSPLIVIEGFAQELLTAGAEMPESTKLEYVQEIAVAARRMHQLIDDLLGLSQIVRVPLQRRSVDLSAQALEIAERLRHSLPERRVEFSIAPGLQAEADPDLLHTALENLLTNAWKFTAHRELARIEVSTCRQPSGERVYYVRDNGVGFNLQYADKLFSPFQRLHAQKDFAGAGIGLAMVQRVIHRHGGAIWAEAEAGKGATFYFTLPALGVAEA